MSNYNKKLYLKLKHNKPIKVYELIYLVILACAYSVANTYYEWHIRYLNRKIAELKLEIDDSKHDQLS